MEEKQISMKTMNITVDDGKKYKIDVNENTTFYEFKKILNASTHLLKGSYKIYLEQEDQVELGNEYNDIAIKEMFLDQNAINLQVYSNQNISQKELTCFSFDINNTCEIHKQNMKIFYCLKCKKSICFDCINEEHNQHKVENKTDLICPAEILLRKIFADSSLFMADSQKSKYLESLKFQSKLKENFSNFRNLINNFENDLLSILDYFSKLDYNSKLNTNANLDLLYNYCIELLIDFKNDIGKNILVDDEKFLTLFQLLDNIKIYKNEFFSKNAIKYMQLNALLPPFIEQVSKITDELSNAFKNNMNKEIFEKFKNSINENKLTK